MTAVAATSRKFTKKQLAAILVAEDTLTDEAIAREVGVSRRSLANWKLTSEFNALVGDAEGQIKAEALKLPIAKKVERLKQLNELNETYWQIKQARGERHRSELPETPEGAMARMYGDFTPAEAATGMLARQAKVSASGKVVVDWVFDKALDSAIKETHKQAAQELGQWSEKSEVQLDGGMRIEIVGMADDDMP